MFWRCSSEVKVVLRLCPNDIQVVFHRCSFGVPVTLWWCYCRDVPNDVQVVFHWCSSMFQRCSGDVPWVFRWCSSDVLGCSGDIPLMFQWCFSDVPEAVWWCSMGISAVFRVCSSEFWNFNISETFRASATCEMTLSTSLFSNIFVFYGANEH